MCVCIIKKVFYALLINLEMTCTEGPSLPLLEGREEQDLNSPIVFADYHDCVYCSVAWVKYKLKMVFIAEQIYVNLLGGFTTQTF